MSESGFNLANLSQSESWVCLRERVHEEKREEREEKWKGRGEFVSVKGRAGGRERDKIKNEGK